MIEEGRDNVSEGKKASEHLFSNKPGVNLWSLKKWGREANPAFASVKYEMRVIKTLIPGVKSSPNKFPKFQGAFVLLDAVGFMLVTGKKKNAHRHTHD